MNKKLFIIGFLLLAVLGIPSASSQSADMWFMRTIGGTKYVMPVVPTWVVRMPNGGSGKTLTVSSLKNCDTLDTDANGVLSCGTDGGGTTYTAGQGIQIVGSVISRLIAITGSTLNLTSTLSASGSASFDGMVYANAGITGALTGNASTATALFANGANCAANQYPLGVDASGAVESCTADANTTYTEGTGMDLTGTQFDFDSTEVAATTWGGGGEASFGWTFATMGTDPSITFSSNLIRSNNDVTVGGAFSGASVFASTPIGMTSGGTNKNMTAVAGAMCYSDADSLELTAVGSSGALLTSQAIGAPVWKSDVRTLTWVLGGGIATGTGGTAVIMPFECDVTGLEMAINQAPVTQLIRVDIDLNGTSIFSTKPEIDTAALVDDNNHAFSTTELKAGDRVNVEVEQAGGSGGSGTGMTLLLSCTRHP